jgi:hypothetical protein
VDLTGEVDAVAATPRAVQRVQREREQPARAARQSPKAKPPAPPKVPFFSPNKMPRNIIVAEQPPECSGSRRGHHLLHWIERCRPVGLEGIVQDTRQTNSAKKKKKKTILAVRSLMTVDFRQSALYGRKGE